MQKILMFFLLLAVLVGGALAVMILLELGPYAPPPEEKTAEQLELEREIETTSVKIKPFNIPIFQGTQVSGSMQVQFALEIPKGQEPIINDNMIRLEDAYLRDLYVFLPRLLRNRETLDIIALKNRLMRVTESIIGTDVVENILIQSVADNPG